MGKKEKPRGLKDSSAPVDLSAPKDLYAEDPLEALLDEESDHEFGDLIVRDAARQRAGVSVKLADWTAQDFSSIYMRFRPHLERHARRFLTNQSQVDEVVQDAFLYLMVSLPELDSEIGVLRFLKWKTRLLCLDVIRASGRAYINNIDDIAEPASDDPEVSSYLEGQDDAAVVRLALSKLNPRHREVLIASMYEEKSTEEIASQVGLSENATRQLIFRARSAFKKALIGDIDTNGMSAAAILSVAARKAAAESKKIGASAMAFVLLMVMAISVWPAFTGTSRDNVAGPANSSEPTNSGSTDSTGSENTGSTDGTGTETPSPSPTGQDSATGTDTNKLPSPVASLNPTPSVSPSPVLTDENLSKIFDTTTKTNLLQNDEFYSVTTETGIAAEFKFNSSKKDPFTEVLGTIEIEDTLFQVYPDSFEVFDATDNDGYKHFVYFGSMTYVFDDKGKVWTDSDLAKGTLRIEVILEKNGTAVKKINLTILSKG